MPAQWEIDLWRKQQSRNKADLESVDDATARRALAYTGRKVVILGDTCNSDTFLSIGRDADLLSHEATFSDNMEDKAFKAQHSTASMAGAFARKLDAKQLMLTHFSPRYRSGKDLDGNNAGDIKLLISQAKRAFGKDAVQAASDFKTWNVPMTRDSDLAASITTA